MLQTYTSIEKSIRSIRSVIKTEEGLKLFINKQGKEFVSIKKNFPGLDRKEALKISFLNAGIKLKDENKSELYALALVRRSKISPQLDWLKLHRSFVFKLRENEASLREIERAIYYRFHRKISHTQIAKFLNQEVKYA